ncbi:MAG: carotenoid oxygenase family protein [Cyanobacteria bacterium J06621_11]
MNSIMLERESLLHAIASPMPLLSNAVNESSPNQPEPNGTEPNSLEPKRFEPNSIVWGKQGEGETLKQAQKEAWSAAFRSQLQEFDYEITEIEGEIPQGLRGSTLFRNGPSRFERGRDRVSHYLDGDGYLVKIAFSPEGSAHFTSKFIQTAEHQAEAATDTFQFRTTFGNPPAASPLKHLFNLHLKNPSNTHVVAWGKQQNQKLLALYEAGAPYRIDPNTLETIGAEDLNGHLNSKTLPSSKLAALKRRAKGQQAMTAHPHIDPVCDRLVTWTWGIDVHLGKPNSLVIELTEYCTDWQPQSQIRYQMPGAAINPHDFALTSNYYVFFENAFSLKILPYLLGQKAPADCLSLDPRPTKVHLIPRPDGAYAGSQPLVLETAQWFSIHQACAWENSDGSVEVYSSGWPATEGGFLTSWSGYAPDFDAIAPTYLWQTVINPATKSVTHQIAPGTENCCIAHPHTNPLKETQKSRYLYMAYCNNIGESSPPTGYLRLDTHTQEQQIWMSHSLCFSEEPVIVADPNGQAEDDGWLLAMMYDHLKERSSLAIFDTRDVSAGPVCRLWFTHHLAHGLHGSHVFSV